MKAGRPHRDPRRGFLRRRWLGITAVVALAVVGTLVLGRQDGARGRWVPVEHRDLVMSVEVTGELVSEESASLGPPAVDGVYNFKLSFVVPEGTEIRQGQPVMGFDTTELQQRLQQVASERDTAQKNLEKRRTDLDIERRSEALALAEAEARQRRASLKTAVPERVIASKDLQAARIDQELSELEIRHRREHLEHLETSSRAELAGLAAARDRAALRLEEIQRQIAAMRVPAPRAGTVIYVPDWRGDKLKVGDSVWRGRKVLEIPDLQTLRADGEVFEARAGRLEVGQPVTLTLDAFPDEEIHGTLQALHRTVQARSWSDPRKVVRLEVALGVGYSEVDPERMRPGMRFSGRVEVGRVPGALTLPLAAVIPGAEAAVRVRSAVGEELRRPGLGERNDTWVEVRSGLREGDRVWVGDEDGA